MFEIDGHHHVPKRIEADYCLLGDQGDLFLHVHRSENNPWPHAEDPVIAHIPADAWCQVREVE
ncbi:hypothetical protein MYP14_20865 [Rhodococcus pyridinivorans]|uniref:hypothetical protein n=1 Tax=Rhodococcus pyridinivorans TaxID=103816 RepID=UPI001FFF4FBD|nr:hypothetical protein [Rhodococcus pyridinivorans]UPK63146.1 hypothetical protein MYP14_20865 [Rhodococcus pyridinivorans]